MTDTDHRLSGPNSFRLGAVEVFPDRLILRREGVDRKLEPLAMDLLVYGSRRAGQVLSPQQILVDVWGNTHRVPDALHRVVSQIRKALDDPRDDPEFIETIPRRGYRFLRTPETAGEAEGEDIRLTENSVRTSPLMIIVAVALLIFATAVVVLLLEGEPVPAPAAPGAPSAPSGSTETPAPESG